MPELSLDRFAALRAERELSIFRDEMLSAGYAAFYAFVEQFRAALKGYADEEVPRVAELIGQGRKTFPDPGRFSPSWARVWEQFERIAAAKNEALAAVRPADRTGEWQVLIDNPYRPQQVVCYPELSFLDAAYAYGYFRLELEPNEVLRLQKVELALRAQGERAGAAIRFD